MRTPRALALLLLFCAPAAWAKDLATLEMHDGWGRPLTEGAPVRVVLELSPGAERLPHALAGRWHPPHVLEEGALVLEGLVQQQATDPARRQHRKPSFLLDYEEDAFVPVRAQVREQLGERPTPEALARFVDRYLERKGLLRSYDVASVVARRREGDCTEHAVLLAALARASGHAARVVNGLVLVSEQGRLQAVGHAWVEVREKAGWRRVDAALPAEVGAYYIPLAVIEEEGPGYGFALASALGPHHVRRVRLEPMPKPGP